MDASGELANPDQRIAEDVRAFTVTTLSFVLMLLNGSLTIIAFSGVLWAISPLLFVLAVLYAACGSLVTFALGRPLIRLNHDQLDKEASFRSALIHVRENAESIMLAHREERQTARLLDRFAEVVANFRQITAINRNVGFFTTGYNWLIQIIPALIVAPSFMRGDVEFGVVTQSAMVFTTLVAAFSLIVTQFQSISTFAAVVARLSSMLEAIEHPQTAAGSTIEIVEAEGRVAYERADPTDLDERRPTAEGIVDIDPRRDPRSHQRFKSSRRSRVVQGDAGVAIAGAGRILRPRLKDISFLPQQPYLPPGTLRQILEDGERGSAISDDRIFTLLRELNLEQVVTQAGGLDSERDWRTLRSAARAATPGRDPHCSRSASVRLSGRVGTVLSSDEVQKNSSVAAQQLHHRHQYRRSRRAARCLRRDPGVQG